MLTTSKRFLRGGVWLILIALFFTLAGLGASASSPTLNESVTEWAVPTGQSGPWGLALDQMGSCCWFVEYYGNKIGHFDSNTGSFQEWEIPTPNANPYSVAVTSVAGNTMVWGTEFASDKIFAFVPTTGEFSEYSLPSGGGASYVSIEPQPGTVRVWFTQPTGDRNGEFVYDSTSGNVTLYQDTFPAAVGGGAYDVHAFSGYVWFAGFASLVMWSRASDEYTIWPLPAHNGAVGRFLAFDSLGRLWYTQGSASGSSNDNFVGMLNGNVIQEWRIPRMGSNPKGIAVNPVTQQPWIAEQSSLNGNGTVTNLNDFGNGTLSLSSPLTAPSAATAIVLSPVSSRLSAMIHSVTPTIGSAVVSDQGPFIEYALGPTLPTDVIVDSSGNVWASEPAANKIVRLSLSNPDYALTPTSSFVSLAQGSSTSLAVTATSVSGYVGDLTFTSANLPAGVTLSTFDPHPLHVPSGGNASSSFVVYATPRASPGIDLISIEANDGTTSHTIGLILTVTNGTSTSQQQETSCLFIVPILIPKLTLLTGLLIDVLIGALFIGLPPEYFSRRLRLVEGLNRKYWLTILLLAPSLLAVGSVLLMIC